MASSGYMQFSDGNFNRLFPFYLEIDRQLIIRKSGKSMAKIMKGQLNASLAEHFQFVRPRLSVRMAFDSMLQQLDVLIILEHRLSGVRFRGQLIYEDSVDRIFFLASPWFTDIKEIELVNLNLNDFALQDTITDTLQLLRSKVIANEDLTHLNEELIQQRDQLMIKNAEIKQAEEKYKALVESSGDIIYRVNSEGQYIYVNPVAVKITGYSEEELLGQHYSIMLDEMHKTKLANFYYFQLTQNIESTYVEFQAIKKNGDVIWLGQSVNLIQTADGDYEYIALARDITDRKVSEKALIQSEEKYKSIIENMELGLLEVDRDNKIIRAYPKFCEMVGYTEAEIIGKDSASLLLDEEQMQVLAAQNAKREIGQSSVYEIQLTKKNGEKLWVIISGAPYYDLNDEYIGSVGIHLDISERKRFEQEINQARELAESSLKAREIFMANMSHEIRTPLNAVLGMSQLLLQTDLNPMQQKYLRAIASSSENLLTIINDILNFSKIEANKLELELIPVDLSRLLEQSIEMFQLKADEKDVLLHAQLSGNLAPAYSCDPLRLSEVLNNLISNALKFTPEGEVVLKCDVETSDNSTDLLHFAIKDTGIGIAKDKHESIFEQFTQASESISRQYGGTGLGLAISRELVSLFGGQLQLESSPGKGSTFYFSIPMKRLDASSLKNESSHEDTGFLNDKSVLIVDDNEINLMVASAILENLCRKVVTCTSGPDALKLVEQQGFDVILMDIRMPGMDGLETTRKLKQELAFRGPIIALTANIQTQDQQHYLEAGMEGYVSKPIRQEELFRMLATVLDAHGKNAVNQQTSAHLHLNLLHESFPDQPELREKMTKLFITNTRVQLAAIRTAIGIQDAIQIKADAHKLKSSLGYFASQQLVELAKWVELEPMIDDYFFEQARVLTDELQLLTEALE